MSMFPVCSAYSCFNSSLHNAFLFFRWPFSWSGMGTRFAKMEDDDEEEEDEDGDENAAPVCVVPEEMTCAGSERALPFSWKLI